MAASATYRAVLVVLSVGIPLLPELMIRTPVHIVFNTGNRNFLSLYHHQARESA